MCASCCFTLIQKAGRSWQSSQKDFLSSFSSVTAVVSGECNFCPIDAHPIQNFITDQTTPPLKMVKVVLWVELVSHGWHPNKKKE